MQSYGCKGDGLTGEPADALEDEDRVDVIRDRFVLVEEEWISQELHYFASFRSEN